MDYSIYACVLIMDIFKGCSIKEINRVLSNGVSNIHLKVTKLTFSQLRIFKLKALICRSVFGSSNSHKYNLMFKTIVATSVSEAWEQKCVWFF